MAADETNKVSRKAGRQGCDELFGLLSPDSFPAFVPSSFPLR
jgi:hypothetical protein